MIQFLGSFPSYDQCPQSQAPEYAFFGRSNVGKSSLINSLLNNSNIAKVSSTPGKTQHINLFNIDNTWQIADLPGYGYAKTSKKIRQAFHEMTRHYLLFRKNMTCLYLLIDIRIPCQQSDLQCITWAGEYGIPFSIVFTKADKLSKTQVSNKKKTYEQVLYKTWEQLPNIFVTSSVSRQGIDLLHKNIISINRL